MRLYALEGLLARLAVSRQAAKLVLKGGVLLAYQGVRVVLMCGLASARISLHVDVNVGDPVWPAPLAVTLPGLLGRDVTLSGYPLTMVHAEKIVTAVERGPATTRWRDFADIYALSARHPIHGHELVGSIERVAAFRSTAPRALADVLRAWLTAPRPRG